MTDGLRIWFWWWACPVGCSSETTARDTVGDPAWVSAPCPTCGRPVRQLQSPPQQPAPDSGLARAAPVSLEDVNATRAVLREALHRGGPEWADALPELAAWLRAGFKADRRAFVADVARDLEVQPSPTLRWLVVQALLDDTPDVEAALQRVGEAIDERENPDRARVVWRETWQQVVAALYRALRAEDRARTERARARARPPMP